MSLIENIANNIKVLHKVKSVPTNTSKIGIHLVEGGGVYIVSKDPINPTLRVVKKIYESSDYYMKGDVDTMLSAQKQLLDEADAILQSQVTDLQQTTATHTADIQSIKDEYVANKGYYNSLATLQAAYPTPKAGDIAYVANVASTTGYYIHNVVGGAWTATTVEAPPVSVSNANYAEHGYTGTPKTLKEVDDDLAQLESDVEQLAYVKIKNEVVNGNFENGLIGTFSKNDGSGGTSTLAINSSTPISGNYDIRLTITTPATTERIPYLNGLNRAGNIGDKIYLHFYAKILSGIPMIGAINNGARVSATYAGNVINGRNTRIIDAEGTSSNLGLIYFNSRSVWDMQMDNFMYINLTETFGAGNEPTKEGMDLLISTLGIDYFEGEITVPAQKIMQLQLKLAKDLSVYAKKVDVNTSDIATLEEAATLSVVNIIENSSFKDKSLPNWYDINNYSSSVDDGVVTLNGRVGGDITIRPSYETSLIYNKEQSIYASVRVRTKSVNCNSIQLVIHYGGSSYLVTIAKIDNPVPNQWYNLYGIAIPIFDSTEKLRIGVRAYFDTLSLDNHLDFEKITAFDLTDSFIKYGIPYTKDSIRDFTCKYEDCWIENSAPLITIQDIFEKNKELEVLTGNNSNHIDRINSFTSIPVKNIVVNGDFSETSYTNWFNLGDGIVSIQNNEIRTRGKGDTSYLRISYDTTIPYVKGQKMFVSIFVKTDSDNCDSISVNFARAAGYFEAIDIIDNPIKNQWYHITGLFEVTRDLPIGENIRIWVRTEYATEELQSGSTTSLRNFLCVDTSKDFDAVNISYTEDKLVEFINTYENSWFDDTEYYEIISDLIKTVKGLSEEYQDHVITPIYEGGRLIEIVKTNDSGVISTTVINYNVDGDVENVVVTSDNDILTTTIIYSGGEVESITNKKTII